MSIGETIRFAIASIERFGTARSGAVACLRFRWRSGRIDEMSNSTGNIENGAARRFVGFRLWWAGHPGRTRWRPRPRVDEILIGKVDGATIAIVNDDADDDNHENDDD